jgi:hypothetical protein
MSKATGDASGLDGVVDEFRRQVMELDEELDLASQRLRERVDELAKTAAELDEAQTTFEMQRTDLIREAREEGYTLGLAEVQSQTAAGMAMLSDVNAELEAMGEEPLEVEELVHYEIAYEPDGAAVAIDEDGPGDMVTEAAPGFGDDEATSATPTPETGRGARADFGSWARWASTPVTSTARWRSSGALGRRASNPSAADPAESSWRCPSPGLEVTSAT